MLDQSTLPERKVSIYTLKGKLEDIIAAIMDADKKSEQYVADKALEFRSSTILETADKVWTYWKDSVPYKEDPPGKQVIQSPGELWRNRHTDIIDASGHGGTGKGGDCKSFSIACAAIFKALGIPYKYRFISERKEDELHHVYLIVDENIPVDCVYEYFNAEIDHENELDVYPEGQEATYSPLPSASIGSVTVTKGLENMASLDQPGDTGTSWKPLALVAIGLVGCKLIF